MKTFNFYFYHQQLLTIGISEKSLNEIKSNINKQQKTKLILYNQKIHLLPKQECNILKSLLRIQS